MRNEFVSEAVKCRENARRYRGRPEEPFLLRLAEGFEELARTGASDNRGVARQSAS
jgi:hypothetical protein